MRGTLENKKILDFGNITRDDLYRLIFDIVTAKKIPITIGGNHSITTIILQAVDKALDRDKVSLIYFDAHPDFVSSTRNYYGSVITDSSNYIDFKNKCPDRNKGC